MAERSPYERLGHATAAVVVLAAIVGTLVGVQIR
jgi:hypothetical protein